MDNTSKTSGAFRKKRVYFTQVSNHILRNDKVSLKAKGLYSLIQSYLTIDDFTLYKSYLMKQCKEGEKAFESAWKELKDAGYLVQYKLKDKTTGTFYYEYDLLEEVNQEKNPDLQKGSVDKNETHTPKTEVVENVGGGKCTSAKQGVYINTNSNNTNLNNIDKSKKDKEPISINSSKDIEEKFYSLMKEELSEVSFNTWIKPLKIHIEEKITTILITDEFTSKIIKEKFLDIIEKIFNQLGIKEVKIA